MKLKFRNFPIGKIILCMDLTIAVITGVVYRDFNNTLYSVIAMSSPPWRSTASSTAWIIPRSRSSSRRSMRPSPRPSTASSTAV